MGKREKGDKGSGAFVQWRVPRPSDRTRSLRNMVKILSEGGMTFLEHMEPDRKIWLVVVLAEVVPEEDNVIAVTVGGNAGEVAIAKELLKLAIERVDLTPLTEAKSHGPSD